MNEALAMRINGDAAGEAARIARRRGVPLLHISTDYVFDGAATRPYREDDPTGPTSAYGRTKLAGERAVLDADPTATILRTAWVYSPFSVNFVKTMLRLGETRSEVSVVADQRGNPSYALDLADAVLSIARQRVQRRSESFGAGVYHMTGSGQASWADLAEEVFAEAQRLGRPPVKVKRITSAEYPTPTRRPANSQLDNSKLARVFGVVLPDWRASTRDYRDWNKKYAWPKLIISTTPEMFHEFEKRYGDKLPVYRGDMTPYWEDGAGLSALKQASTAFPPTG